MGRLGLARKTPATVSNLEVPAESRAKHKRSTKPKRRQRKEAVDRPRINTRAKAHTQLRVAEVSVTHKRI